MTRIILILVIMIKFLKKKMEFKVHGIISNLTMEFLAITYNKFTFALLLNIMI